MIPKEFQDISLHDIENIFETSERETRTLEFKRELKLTPDKERKEFLADITSFANSSGGDIFFGVDEEKGVVGMEVENIDDFLLQIQSVIRDNTDPTPVYQINGIKTNDGRLVIFLRISKSFAPPVQITFKGSGKYFGRDESGKFHLKASDLRRVVLASGDIKKRINDFLTERTVQILSSETPVLLRTGPKIIFHLISLPSFSDNREHLLTSTTLKRIELSPLGNSKKGGYEWRVNFDGVVSYPGVGGLEKESYVQINKNGSIEGVHSLRDYKNDNFSIFPSTWFVKELYLFVGSVFHSAIHEIGYEYPLIMKLGIFGIKGFKFATGSYRKDFLSDVQLRKNDLIFNEIHLNQIPESIPKILKYWFDPLWHAFGHEYCSLYRRDKEIQIDGKVYI